MWLLATSMALRLGPVPLTRMAPPVMQMRNAGDPNRPDLEKGKATAWPSNGVEAQVVRGTNGRPDIEISDGPGNTQVVIRAFREKDSQDPFAGATSEPVRGRGRTGYAAGAYGMGSFGTPPPMQQEVYQPMTPSAMRQQAQAQQMQQQMQMQQMQKRQQQQVRQPQPRQSGRARQPTPTQQPVQAQAQAQAQAQVQVRGVADGGTGGGKSAVERAAQRNSVGAMAMASPSRYGMGGYGGVVAPSQQVRGGYPTRGMAENVGVAGGYGNARGGRVNRGYPQGNQGNMQVNRGYPQGNQGNMQVNRGYSQGNMQGNVQANGYPQVNQGNMQVNQGNMPPSSVSSQTSVGGTDPLAGGGYGVRLARNNMGSNRMGGNGMSYDDLSGHPAPLR